MMNQVEDRSMQVPVSNRTLLRSLLAGAVVLFSTNACSRPDRTESGSNNTAATAQDTAVTGATQDVPGSGQDRMATDTANPTSENTGTGAAAGDTAPAEIKSNAPRATTAAPSAERKNTTAPSGVMTRDTGAVHEDSARVTEDTSETSMNQADTSSVAGYSEMARDTTSGADQIDTAATAATGASGAEAQDTSMNAGRVRPIEDSTETMGQVTTSDTGNVAATADTIAGDAAIAARGADTTGNAGRIRPPEDSTEMQGNVSSAESATVNAADTADEAPVSAEASQSDTDRATAVAPENRTDAVGAAAVGGTVTGADAVALMTRGGERCDVVDPELDEEVRWDMSSTPSTLNPCGLGSMNLSKVWTEGQRGE
jgi:hypothetical protein